MNLLKKTPEVALEILFEDKYFIDKILALKQTLDQLPDEEKTA